MKFAIGFLALACGALWAVTSVAQSTGTPGNAVSNPTTPTTSQPGFSNSRTNPSPNTTINRAGPTQTEPGVTPDGQPLNQGYQGVNPNLGVNPDHRTPPPNPTLPREPGNNQTQPPNF